MIELDKNLTCELLIETGSIIKTYETISRETGADFNIFNIVITSREKEKLVCRVLYELLNPRGSHGQNSAYLELFVRDCLKLEDELSFNSEQLEGAEVFREYPTDKGRQIDLVIKIGGRFIPIEVKIDSAEGENQCSDYYEFARTQNSQASQTKLVYLTKDRQEPKSLSRKQIQDNVILISFKDDILRWIEKCLTLPDTVRKTPIREILIQFSAAIKGFTNPLEDKPMNDMKDLLYKSPENMKNAVAISNAVNSCKTDMILELLKAIEQGVDKEKLPYMDYETEDDGKEITEFYGRKKRYPAINYHFMNVENNVDIWFRVEIEWTLYAGLCVVVKNENVGWQDCKSLKIEQLDGSWWSKKFQYLPSENKYPHFKNNDDNFYKLFDKQYFDGFVKECVKRIDKLWKQWEKEIN